MEQQTTTINPDEILEMASEAGHVLLENGAEISCLEDTMERIAMHYGVRSGHFFVLSNGIFTTSSQNRYAKVEFIPIRAIQLSKVVEINRLSYRIAAGGLTVAQARAQLEKIKSAPVKPAWEQIAGAAFGAAGFCAVFGGGFTDCAADFVIGALLYMFCLFISGPRMSKIVSGICNALAATLLCIASYKAGFGNSLSNIIIGAIMPLIPGVPFVNGVRDLADSDYIAGMTRLTDAMLGFFCIALGVGIGFMLDGFVSEGMIHLSGMTVDAATADLGWQTIAAFIGTLAFAILFGVPRRQYLPCGIIGAIGWAAFLMLTRDAGVSSFAGITLASMLICILSRIVAVIDKCPSTVYLLCGIFPLVPGAGIFWFTYYLVSSHFHMSAMTGYTAVTAAVAIVLGIILAMELPQRLFSRRHLKANRH